MNKIIYVIAVVSWSTMLWANVQPTNVRQIIERESGGMITTTFKNTKKIYFVNAQSRASKDLIELTRQRLDAALKTPIDIIDGTFDFSTPKIYGELSLYIIDDEKLPMSLIAPEGRWAFVNIAHLYSGRGKKPSFFEARVKKQIARIGCMLFGGIGSTYNSNLLSFIENADGLDRYESDDLPVDGMMRCTRYLINLGVKPYRRISYRKACREGWAPTPTNDIQKAIWDKVHAAPKNPIKIEFDPKKGR